MELVFNANNLDPTYFGETTTEQRIAINSYWQRGNGDSSESGTSKNLLAFVGAVEILSLRLRCYNL